MRGILRAVLSTRETGAFAEATEQPANNAVAFCLLPENLIVDQLSQETPTATQREGRVWLPRS